MEGKVVIAPKCTKKPVPLKTACFDNAENDLIGEIALRKSLKRKSETILPYRAKIFKMDTNSNRRKNRQPKKLEFRLSEPDTEKLSFSALERICEQMEKNVTVNFADIERLGEYTEQDKQTALEQVEKEISNSLPQICLLCETKFPSGTALASHVFDIHGIDMTQLTQPQQQLQPQLQLPQQQPQLSLPQPQLPHIEAAPEKKRKIPNLVKITDLKLKSDLTGKGRFYNRFVFDLRSVYIFHCTLRNRLVCRRQKHRKRLRRTSHAAALVRLSDLPGDPHQPLGPLRPPEGASPGASVAPLRSLPSSLQLVRPTQQSH